MEVNLNLGDLVCLKTHERFRGTSLDAKIISGEFLGIPPLLIVVEIKKDKKNTYDTSDGKLLVRKNDAMVKVVWFEDKSFQILDTWIHSSLLARIEIFQKQDQNDNLEAGDSVALRTCCGELKKMKHSIVWSDLKVKSSFSPLLSYVSPPLVVVSKRIEKNGVKKYDDKTGELEYEKSEIFVKVKYYNHINCKFTEIELPIFCLEKIIKNTSELERKLEEIAKNASYFRADKVILGSNLELHFVNGNLIVHYFDFQEEGFKFYNDDLNSISAITSSEQLILPEFRDELGELKITQCDKESIEEIIQNYVLSELFAVMKYENSKKEFSKRFIKIDKIVALNSSKSTEDEYTDYYLKAYCYRKKAFRFFKITRINELEIFIL